MASVRSQIGDDAAWHPRTMSQRVMDILKLPGSPQVVAQGAAIGIFLAFTPTLGVQMILAGILAAALRASKAAAIASVWISNPLTAAPIYASTYGLGIAVMPNAGPIAALTLGGLLLGTLAGCISYRLIYRAIEVRRQVIVI